MKSGVIALAIVLLQFAGTWPARAQGANDQRIFVQVKVGRQDGGERRSAWTFIDPGAIGKTSTVGIYRLAGQCGIGIGNDKPGEVGEAHDGKMKKVSSAWVIHLTPTRQAGEAVTFRVQWTRILDNGKASTLGDDTELTLRPGQSLSLDVMAQSPEKSEPPPGCVIKALLLSVGVVHWPEPDEDRRLVAVDLWLVERRADGTERSQPLSLRGRYNQPIPFYFDTVTDGTKTLDVFGDLQISPGAGPIEVKMTTRSRVIDLKPAVSRPPGYPAAVPWPPDYTGSTTATLRLAPNEVVSVPLPPVGRGGDDADAFAARALSYRIRVRPIR